MSRVGKKPIAIPGGVNVNVSGRTVQVEGPKGKLSLDLRPEVEVAVEDSQVVVTRHNDDRISRAMHGMMRSLLANMVQGVSEGYVRHLEVYGTGYGVQAQGPSLTINCGKSHPEVLAIPAGVTIEVQTPQARGDDTPAKFSVSGPDKQMVGEFAARCRRCRPPEPYKGKGVRYAGEYVRRKMGKAFAGGGG